MNGWIGVDLDGTLAHYDEWAGPAHIGQPVASMVDRVREWLGAGFQVRVVTARVNPGGTDESRAAAQLSRDAIREWTMRHVGVPLVATCAKDYGMLQLWDDRATGVVPNTGVPAARAAVMTALQYCLDKGAAREMLDGAGIAAGYAVRYHEAPPAATDLQREPAARLSYDLEDASVTLYGTPVRRDLATVEQRESARAIYCDSDDITVDDDARVSETEAGAWVGGWLWVPNS